MSSVVSPTGGWLGRGDDDKRNNVFVCEFWCLCAFQSPNYKCISVCLCVVSECTLGCVCVCTVFECVCLYVHFYVYHLILS